VNGKPGRELDYRFTGQSYVKLFCVIVSHVVAVSGDLCVRVIEQIKPSLHEGSLIRRVTSP